MKRNTQSFIINLGLLILGFLTVFSGLLLQIKYHIGNHGFIDIEKQVLGLGYYDWSWLHKIVISFLFIFAAVHIYLHWKWYKGVIKKRLFAKNKQTVTLSILFAIVAITSFSPWLIDAMNEDNEIRKTFIEIHDKAGIILTIYLFLHVFKRFKWFLK